MAELKKAVNKMEEQGIPRAVLSEGILTIDVDSHVETMEEQEDARWHQLLNAHRTKKILTGQLGGIEKLDSGWTVAITYYNGFRILIPMDEMMINLSGDGREHSDTLNRQTRIGIWRAGGRKDCKAVDQTEYCVYFAAANSFRLCAG